MATAADYENTWHAPERRRLGGARRGGHMRCLNSTINEAHLRQDHVGHPRIGAFVGELV